MSLFLLIGDGRGVLPAAPAKTKRLVIKDYRKLLNRKFKKVKRKSTRFIIVHTTEAGLESTLRTLSQGKRVSRRYRTSGGHANYAIARNGTVYRILHHKYRADHAGLSMWNGYEDVSSHSVGIELVGFHYADITDAQYRSLSELVRILRKQYKIPGKNVLTHCQVSYGKPNQWIRHPHRGRKRCALNFNRSRIGLGDQLWTYDPDVKAGRLKADRSIYTVFYKSRRPGRKPAPVTPKPPVTVPVKLTPPPSPTVANSNIISKENTAWNIAGEDFKNPSTVYILPDKKEIRGHEIGEVIGWDRIPGGTQVLLNQSPERDVEKGPVFEITRELTAWSYAGKNYNAASTFYFFQHGGFVPGTRVEDWDSLPAGTRMIIGYRPPVEIGAVRGKTPWSIAGRAYKQKQTIYYIPDRQVMTGQRVANFNDLPNGSMIFLKL